MKKPQEKRDIIIRGVNSQFVKDRGGQVWIRNNVSWFLLYMIALIGSLAISDFFVDSSLLLLGIELVVFGGLYIYGALRFTKFSNRYWERYKDCTEPIELPVYGNVSWRLWGKDY